MMIAPGSRSTPSFRLAVGKPLAGGAVALVLAALATACPLAVYAAPTPAASSTPVAGGALDAADLGALRMHVNEQVTVQGTPTKTGHSKAGNVVYLDFGRAHQALALVFFVKGGRGGVTSEDDLKQFVGKPVTVTGQLTDFKGDLQMKVENLDQIKLAP